MENENSAKELGVAAPIEAEEESAINDSNEEMTFTDTSNNIDDSNENETQSNEISSEVESSKKDNKSIQTKEERATFAQKRREREEREKAIQDAYKKGRLEAFKGRVNPFTQTVMQDEADIEVYEAMCKLEAEGKDPISDYAIYAADKRREESREKERQKEIEENAKKDVEDFINKYPKVDLNELLADPLFKDYIEGKSKSLVELYDNFNELKSKFRAESIKQAEQTIANAISTPGSLNNYSSNTIDYASMSREEFLKEVERVKNGD